MPPCSPLTHRYNRLQYPCVPILRFARMAVTNKTPSNFAHQSTTTCVTPFINGCSSNDFIPYLFLTTPSTFYHQQQYSVLSLKETLLTINHQHRTVCGLHWPTTRRCPAPTGATAANLFTQKLIGPCHLSVCELAADFKLHECD